MQYSAIILSLLLGLAQPLSAKDQRPPDQISSARSVAVVAHAIKKGGGRYLGISDPGLEEQLSSEVRSLLGGVPTLSVVTDPGSADLVFTLLFADWKTRYGEDLGMVFPGGARSSAASCVPLWVGEGQSGFSAADSFLAELGSSKNATSSVHFLLPGRVARSRSRLNDAGSVAPKTLRPGVPDELLRAKSAAVFGYSAETPWGIQLHHPFFRGSLAASLEKWGRFKIVDNSQDADLIVVIYNDQHLDSDIDSRRSKNYTREALVIIDNTRKADIAPMPLWMEQVEEKEFRPGLTVKLDMIHVLRGDIERAERNRH